MLGRSKRLLGFAGWWLVPRIARQAASCSNCAYCAEALSCSTYLDTSGFASALNETEVVLTDLPLSDFGLKEAFQSDLLVDFFAPECNQLLFKWVGMPNNRSTSYLKPKFNTQHPKQASKSLMMRAKSKFTVLDRPGPPALSLTVSSIP